MSLLYLTAFSICVAANSVIKNNIVIIIIIIIIIVRAGKQDVLQVPRGATVCIPVPEAVSPSGSLLPRVQKIIIIIITSLQTEARENANSLPIWPEGSLRPQAMTDDDAFLLQRVSVLVQRYNAVLLHDTLPATDCTD